MTDWRPTADLGALRLRAQLYATIRAFFAERAVLEVETPILSMAGNTDANIESFSLEFSGRIDSASRTRWLRTSPEFPLKRLLAAGVGDCYELGRVFRNGEAGGRHNPEFTMLEWYRVGWCKPPSRWSDAPRKCRQRRSAISTASVWVSIHCWPMSRHCAQRLVISKSIRRGLTATIGWIC